MSFKRVPRRLSGLFAGALLGLGFAETVFCQPYALVSKNMSDNNFIVAFRSFAAEARKDGASAVHFGEAGASHFRNQDDAVSLAVEAGIKGLAISVINSDWLSRNSFKKVQAAGIPVITFDSDFEKGYEYLRKAYVGTDNEQFGYQIAETAMKYRSGGGTVWLMSDDSRAPNLENRIHGARIALSGDRNWPRGKRLSGENGWTEDPRSPWYCGDDIDRSLEQLKTSLRSGVDVFLALGHWPVVDPDKYAEAVAPFADRLRSRKTIAVFGVGTPSAAQRALLDRKLLLAFVAIDFDEIGREAYRALKKITMGQAVPAATYVRSAIIE